MNKSITAWDDRTSTADTDQHNDAGICSSCGHWYPESEYRQPWRAAHPDTAHFCVTCHSEAHEPDGDNPQY